MFDYEPTMPGPEAGTPLPYAAGEVPMHYPTVPEKTGEERQQDTLARICEDWNIDLPERE